ncbi:hypothetical protein [Tychonema sp. LEGE 07203]|uniref:hypothetical protein n=1 Tax=Tychonema sp. LEGE 07203 TaxID=1828671 RepID=UPI0019FB7A6B|nr:hypothetical protein [Tychonema sp. LEGE 07203]MBE9096412.1 hypothetical protein [Tychonema sp. LEGE 07203]
MQHLRCNGCREEVRGKKQVRLRWESEESKKKAEELSANSVQSHENKNLSALRLFQIDAA